MVNERPEPAQVDKTLRLRYHNCAVTYRWSAMDQQAWHMMRMLSCAYAMTTYSESLSVNSMTHGDTTVLQTTGEAPHRRSGQHG